MSGVAFILALLIWHPASAWLSPASSWQIPPHSALIVVDMQNDFTRPDGSLYVHDAESIIGPINRLTANHGWDVVIFTTDFHPANHISFLDNKPPEVVQTKVGNTFMVGLQYDSNHRICGEAYTHGDLHYGGSAVASCPDVAAMVFQELWPVHCVQGTHGALIDRGVTVPSTARIVRKGITTVIDSYGAFANQVASLTTDAMALKTLSENTMYEMLTDLSIQNVFVTGVALDYCVKHTALQAAPHFRTFVIEDATKAASQDEHAFETAVQELRNHGVDFRLEQALAGRRLSNLTLV